MLFVLRSSYDGTAATSLELRQGQKRSEAAFHVVMTRQAYSRSAARAIKTSGSTENLPEIRGDGTPHGGGPYQAPRSPPSRAEWLSPRTW